MTTYLQDPQLQSYLLKLKKQLQVLPASEREDVLREFESHVYEELQQGRQPALILERLGEPQSYARSYLEQYGDQLRDSGRLPDHVGFMFRQTIGPVLGFAGLFIGLMLANTVFVWWSGLTQYRLPVMSMAQMLLLSLPAILVLCLPICPLFVVPLYVYRLRGSEARQTLRSGRVWLLTLLTGLVFSGASLAVQEYIVPAANTQVVEVIKELMQAPAREQGKPEMVFAESLDVRSMNLMQAYRWLDNNPKADKQDYKDYYSKLSLPLSGLSFALYGLLTASLMLSGLFQPHYTLTTLGVLCPLSLYYLSYSLPLSEKLSSWQEAVIPNLLILGISGLYLIGMLLQLQDYQNKGGEDVVRS